MQLDTAHLALIAVAGGLLGGIVVAIVNGLFALRSNQNEYANDFYKIVLQRRITAYEQLETLIVSLKTSIADEDNKVYHFPFSGNERVENMLQQVGATMSQGIWLSDKCFAEVRGLNLLLFRLPNTEDEIVAFGKDHYQQIAQLRDDLELILAKDMLGLHKVKQFLSRKRKRRLGFEELQLRDEDGTSLTDRKP